jgi:hypothetical protein
MEHYRRSEDERERKSLAGIALKYGLRGGIALSFIFLVMYFLENASVVGDFVKSHFYIHLTDLGLIKYINLPIIFYAIYKGTRIFKIRHHFATISYKDSVLSGIYISVISVSICALFTIVFYKFIDPSSLKDIMGEHYYNLGTRTERAYNFLRPYNITLILSLIYTLIISYFLQKEEHSH